MCISRCGRCLGCGSSWAGARGGGWPTHERKNLAHIPCQLSKCLSSPLMSLTKGMNLALNLLSWFNSLACNITSFSFFSFETIVTKHGHLSSMISRSPKWGITVALMVFKKSIPRINSKSSNGTTNRSTFAFYSPSPMDTPETLFMTGRAWEFKAFTQLICTAMVSTNRVTVAFFIKLCVALVSTIPCMVLPFMVSSTQRREEALHKYNWRGLTLVGFSKSLSFSVISAFNFLYLGLPITAHHKWSIPTF